MFLSPEGCADGADRHTDEDIHHMSSGHDNDAYDEKSCSDQGDIATAHQV